MYGQTGTGKTFTMSGNKTEDGLVQRCMKLLKSQLSNEINFENFSLKMSYLEIYNEKVRDLLSDSFKNVREMAK